MTIWPVPSDLPHTKEGSILIAEPVAFSPASSPALILALTCISCSWLSLKGKSVSSTCKTGETLSGVRSRMKSRFVENARSSDLLPLWGQALGDRRDQSSSFAAAAVWEAKPDLTFREQPVQNLPEAFGIPEVGTVLCSISSGHLQQPKKVFNPVQHPYDSHDVLLRMRLVHGPVHAHRDLQLFQLTVGFDSSQDRRQTGSHQVRRPEGHYGADVLNSHTVLVRRAQTQPS